jgi:uncharacterized protein YndB with AHSA1/START domain
MSADRVSVSVSVSCDPATAFSIFTEETDLWWRRGPAYRFRGHQPGVLKFASGSMIECFESDSGPQEFVRGQVTAWEPGRRIEFDWRGVNFAPGESTTVEVLFEATPTGTRVTVHHSGWAGLPPGHPVRHGMPDPEFIRSVGMWWASLMTALREHAQNPS